MGVALGAVADDGDLLAIELGNVAVGLVIHLESHLEYPSLSFAGIATLSPLSKGPEQRKNLLHTRYVFSS